MSGNEQTILACPACGYTAAVYDYKAMSAVYCEDCGVMGPLGETDYEAIEKWNDMPRRQNCTPLAANTISNAEYPGNE